MIWPTFRPSDLRRSEGFSDVADLNIGVSSCRSRHAYIDCDEKVSPRFCIHTLEIKNQSSYEHGHRNPTLRTSADICGHQRHVATLLCPKSPRSPWSPWSARSAMSTRSSIVVLGKTPPNAHDCSLRHIISFNVLSVRSRPQYVLGLEAGLLHVSAKRASTS
jgi:hypothetical protein